MATIKCNQCGKEIELTEALTKDIEKTLLIAEHQKHEIELARVKSEAFDSSKKETETAIELARKKFTADIEFAKKEAQTELEIAKKKIEADSITRQKKAIIDQEMLVKDLQAEALSEKESNKELREKLSELMQELREERKAKDNAEIEMQKRLVEQDSKIREDVTKSADEKYRLKLAESEKKLVDTQKALDEAQRKAAQGSQQLQGEIMELDMENIFTHTFHDDEIEPVAKGVKGSDIRHIVKNQRGTLCGVILWEIKRTKAWKDEWIATIKTNLLAAKANTPIIITNIMPKQITEDIGFLNGVWVCKPQLAIVLATLLRKGLIEVGQQKVLGQDRGTKADALYSFVTSHEFVQQIESMVETYQEMAIQIGKERVAYERLWSQREKQSQKLLLGTASIIGSMQGHIGQASMPKIKGLDLLESGEELKNI